MTINPDRIEIFRLGPVMVNATIFFTWIVMAVLVAASVLITRRLSAGPKVSKWQGLLETAVKFIYGQVREASGQNPSDFVPFLGTLGLFILTANILEAVPLYHPPTASLSTTAALAASVFFAVPVFGIMKNGILNYLKSYVEPYFFMLPFHIISEFSRTISLAVRLFGNIMSGSLLAAILLLIVPLFIPVVMELFSLLIGTVQAYIFFMLATVYIGSAAAAHKESFDINKKLEEEK